MSLRSAKKALQKRVAVAQQDITAVPTQWQAMSTTNIEPYRQRCISTSIPSRQASGKKMRALGSLEQERRALLKRSLLLRALISTREPNFFNPMLRLNILRQSVCVKRLMDEKAAKRGRHFNICALLHIVSPQQAKKP
ncbi:hypothetical protein AU510_04765 [Lonsdalea britannica]|uniref:hypothetical protein n=1 Tax=Lonsdalea britannica TaxID=1082704 RepID=UPI000A1F71A9|nr:hypothetical protein [Lonsdalea britannica]OSN08154.1 hypothetical protein AU510_04765 [Lonsdalea britannica]